MLNESAIQSVLDEARRQGADYAELRTEQSRSESIHARNAAVERLTSERDDGWGVHVLAGGGWGFASSSSEQRADVPATV